MSVVRPTSPVTSAAARPDFTSAALVPPTIGANTSFDSPKVPWHDAHFSSQSFWPFCTLPDPGGSPLKSGRTSMSQAFTSAAVAARPTPGNCPAWTLATKDNRTTLINLHIGNVPALRDL